MKKIKIAIIFGGKSAEHEISIRSVKNVFNALDKNKYEPILIRINKNGFWYLDSKIQINENKPKLSLIETSREVALIHAKDSDNLIDVSTRKAIERIDVAFPILHGPYGEDGSIQGLFEIVNIPYVEADVTGSSIGMDKDAMKRLLRDAGMQIAKFISFNNYDIDKISFSEIKEKIGLPMFIKPANLGSSVGINKVKNSQEFERSIKIAFRYDKKMDVSQLWYFKKIFY